MDESEIRSLVRQIFMQEIAPILMGTILSNQDNNRSTAQRFSSEGAIGRLRNIQPFGVSSRAPKGTSCLVVPVDGNPTHLNILGHFDEARPAGQDGETFLYDAFGHLIYLSQDKMQFGSKSSAENMVLGQVFKTMMDTLLEAIANHTHVGNLGYSTSVPENQADFLNIKASPIDDDAILSDKAFTEK